MKNVSHTKKHDKDKYNIFCFLFKKCAFSMSKKSANLFKIRPKTLFIQNIDVFDLKLFFFWIFCRRKIGKKIEVKRKHELHKNPPHTVLCNFHIFTWYKYFLILKFQTLLIKRYYLLFQYGREIHYKYVF